MTTFLRAKRAILIDDPKRTTVPAGTIGEVLCSALGITQVRWDGTDVVDVVLDDADVEPVRGGRDDRAEELRLTQALIDAANGRLDRIPESIRSMTIEDLSMALRRARRDARAVGEVG